MKDRKNSKTVTRKDGLANPYIDAQFKLIFDEDVTRLFLNSILRLESPIRTLRIGNSESNDESIVGKRVYFDVFCTDEDGNNFIVEMQNVWLNYLKNRLVYYTSRKVDEMGRQYARQKYDRSTVKWDYRIKRVYTVCLLNDIDGDTDEPVFRQDVSLYDEENRRRYSDTVRIVVINLKLLNQVNMSVDAEYYRNFLLLLEQISKNMTTAEQLLADIDSSTFTEEQKKIFRRVVNISDISTMTDEQLQKYDEELMAYWDYWAMRDSCFKDGFLKGQSDGMKDGMEKGMEKGMKDGMVKGMVKGIEKGIEKGRAAERTERDTFWRGILKEKGFSDAQISEMEKTARQ